MNRKKFFDVARRSFLLLALAFTFAAAASAEWKEKVVYSFQGIPDGAYPAGGVVFDESGNLYGATTDGGANNCPGIAQCGTVFQLRAPVQKGGAWRENVLYVFKGVSSNDGNTPVGGVIFDQAGNLYGTTAYGGTGNCVLFGGRVGCGTVYEMVPPKQKGDAWTEYVLYSFQSGKDGYFPWGDLTFDSEGNLYGATQYGGGKGTTCNSFYQFCGTVFKLSPPKATGGKWTEVVLHSFEGGSDGANPSGGLVREGKGLIYGTTYTGGYNCPHDSGEGCGTVFELKPPTTKGSGWSEEIIHRFRGSPDGRGPAAGLVFGTDNGLYGTTTGGGQASSGSVFNLRPPSTQGRPWNEALVYSFSFSYGGYEPFGGLVFNSTGNLYGAASYGGNGGGTIFELRPPAIHGESWIYTVLYTFGEFPDGIFPESSLVFDKAGNLYGTTVNGGSGDGCQGHCGTVFKLTP